MSARLLDYAYAATGALWLAVRRDGLRRNEWGWTVFPEGCETLPEVVSLTLAVCRNVCEPPEAADPVQLLLRLPDEDTKHAAIQYEPHVDKTPEGELYRHVYGCCLTDAPSGTAIVNGNILGFRAGAVYGWPGYVEHRGVPNFGYIPRITAYWRFR